MACCARSNFATRTGLTARSALGRQRNAGALMNMQPWQALAAAIGRYRHQLRTLARIGHGQAGRAGINEPAVLDGKRLGNRRACVHHNRLARIRACRGKCCSSRPIRMNAHSEPGAEPLEITRVETIIERKGKSAAFFTVYARLWLIEPPPNGSKPPCFFSHAA